MINFCVLANAAPNGRGHLRASGALIQVDQRLQLTGCRGGQSGEPFGAAIIRACCPNCRRHASNPNRLPQSRARQEAAGKLGECFDADETVSCSWLTAVDMCIGWKTRLSHDPRLHAGRGSVGVGGDVMHDIGCDLGNTLWRTQFRRRGPIYLLRHSPGRGSVRAIPFRRVSAAG